MAEVERTVSEQEMVDILEDIARNGGNAAAKIAAIKELRAMGRAAEGAGSQEGFEALDELEPRRKNRSQAA